VEEQFVLEAREELFEDQQTASQQGVEVPRLWDAGAERLLIREVVGLDDRDLFEVVGKHSRDEHAADASTDYDCVISVHDYTGGKFKAGVGG
jgi:hypothetical protein